MIQAIAQLTRCDRDLANVIDTYGNPPFWQRERSFAGLVRIILGQQVSVASANAIYQKLADLVQPLTPDCVLSFSDEQLKSVGLSRQKITYTRALATAIASQQLDLQQLEQHDDDILRQELVKIKGIGDWTVDIYLMMCLQRPDAFPKSDLGVIIAYQKLKNLPTRPTTNELVQASRKWQPWRAVATRILWHYYLSLIQPQKYLKAPQEFTP